VIVRVDREECIGAATCVNEVPAVFELDDEGIARVITPEVDEAMEAAVEDAVAICPVEALSIEQ
jgi:ferredoxin